METPHTEVLIRGAAGEELLRTVLVPGEYVIGHNPECELCIPADLVSPQHARLTLNFDHALIEDLGSDSGTFVNGQPVTEATRLWPGQKIQLGPATLTVQRQKATADDGQSLAPQTAAVRQLLPEKFLREKKYDIGAVVAQGGMGAILDARETTIEREVAMKVMLDSSSPDDISRFVAEARVTGQLEHPNIVPVHELSVDENDQVFYTMKLVRGITLRRVFELLAGGDPAALAKYPLPALLTIFQKICDALAFAHSRGVIHRDLKPENIMLGDYGEALVMDWGLAKRTKDEGGRMNPDVRSVPADSSAFSLPPSSFQTLTGTIMGTPQYMAPEQARGEIEALDARSDIYALGAILYHALTLRSPVEAGSLDDILAKVRAGDIIPPIQRRPPPPPRHPAPAPAPPNGVGAPVPPAVDPSAPTALESGPVAPVQDRRNSSTRKNGDAHRAPLQHLPGGSVPESLNAVVMKAMALEPAARYQSVADLQAEITAYQNGFATSAENAGVIKQVALLIKRHKGAFGTAAAAWLVITALAVWFVINLGIKERRAVAGEQSAIASEGIAKAEAGRATKAEAVAVQEKGSTRRALAKAQIGLAEAAYRDQDGPGMQAVLKEVPEDLRDSNWSYLLENSDTSLASIHPHNAWAYIEMAVPHPTKPGVFAIVGRDHWVTFVDARTGAKLLEFQPGFKDRTSNKYCVAISPDGERLAIGRYGTNGIVIHDTSSGRKLAEWETEDVVALQFSPDGRRLMQSVPNKQLNLRDATTGHLLWSIPSKLTPKAIFNPSGQLILAWLASPKEYRLQLMKADDGTVVRDLPTRNNFQEFTSLAINSDGTQALAGDIIGNVRCFSLPEGLLRYETVADVGVGSRGVSDIAYTPDGRRFVTRTTLSGGRQSIKVWDAETGILLQRLLGGSGADRNEIGKFSVHPLSGELLVGGFNCKMWSLAGQWEKWRLRARGDAISTAFAGTDDLIFGNAGSGVDLLDLQSADPNNASLWRAPNKSYCAVSVSLDGRFAVVALPDGSQVRFLRLNDRTVEEVRTFPVKGSLFGAGLRLSPAGNRLWIGNSVMDPATGRALVDLEMKGLPRIVDRSWVGDTRLLGAGIAKTEQGQPGSEGGLVVWDADTGKQLRTATNPTVINCVAVAPDAKTIAEAGADRMVRLRDPETLAVTKEFRAHDGPILAMAFHPTRPILATASEDLTIKLWDSATGKLLEELRGPLGPPKQVVFSPTGKRIACLSSDRTTRIWEPKSLSEPKAETESNGK